MTSDSIGKEAEEIAAIYLESKGYTILERRYRVRLGEIDLIAKDGSVLAFVEVRYRKDASFGRPEETVDRKKQEKIIRAAMFYLSENGLTDAPVRFDVVALWRVNGKLKGHLYKDAFSGG